MRKTGFIVISALAVILSIIFVGGFARANAGAQMSASTPCASPMASPGASPMAGMEMASPAASPMASPAAECAPAAASATNIQMEAGDLFFKPDAVTIPANTDVTITIKNVGALPHDFYIDALNIKSPLIDPGKTIEVKINAKPGTYEFYCNQPGHKAAGMHGTLTVK
jgi:uncharacterized cupredoxin-like copper-binding protein